MGDCASPAKLSDTGPLAASVSQNPPPSPHSVNAFYTFDDGSTYEGDFALCPTESDDGLTYVQHGTGVYVKGSYKYSGEWRDGKMTHGLSAFPSGDTYEGQFLDGLFHGWGRYTWCKEKKVYEGMWVCGLMEGSGALQYTSVLPGDSSTDASFSTRESPNLVASSAGAYAAERGHHHCTGIFGAGKYHHTPAFQTALRVEYTKRYRRDFLGAAVEVLQRIETALLQNTSYSAYVGGARSTVQGSPQTNPVPAPAVATGRRKITDAVGANGAGMTKKKPLMAPRVSTIGANQMKDPFPGGVSLTKSSSLVEDEKYLDGACDYVAEKYVLPTFPGLNDFHVDGISRLLTSARSYYETGGNTGTSTYSVDVRIPIDEEEALELSLLDRARILDPKAVAGRGSGQTVELILRSSDAASNMLAGIALVNCNDQVATPESAHFRVVALVLPSAQQQKKSK